MNKKDAKEQAIGIKSRISSELSMAMTLPIDQINDVLSEVRDWVDNIDKNRNIWENR